jgi:hypothetical protein
MRIILSSFLGGRNQELMIKLKIMTYKDPRSHAIYTHAYIYMCTYLSLVHLLHVVFATAAARSLLKAFRLRDLSVSSREKRSMRGCWM